MNIVLYPPAKINLGLNVIEKRKDGFHNIETLFIPTTHTDILEIIESDKFSISRYGKPYPLKDNNDQNDICTKAYNLIKKDYNIPPISIHLFKNIPSGGGLGGGSSDGAYMLTGRNSLFNLDIAIEQLEKYALTLGSDCPFFIHSTPMIGRGRGEILSKYSNKNIDSIFSENGEYYIKLYTNDFHVSTAEAYNAIKPYKAEISLEEKLSQDTSTWKDIIINVFEATVF